jgi:hypothetical protein
MRKKTFVSVHGGLGNQLFALGLAHQISNLSNVYLVPWSKNTRKDSTGEVWINHLRLSEGFKPRLSFLDSFFMFYVRGCFKILLLARKHPSYRLIFQTISKLITFLPRFLGIQIITSLELGEVPLPRLIRRNYIFLYHQCIAASNEIRTKLRDELSLTSETKLEISAQQVLVVHIRRTDYAENPEIGLLPDDYYTRAIQQATKVFNWHQIWLFSDDPDEALSIIPKRYHSSVLVMEKSTNSPLEVLALMAQGNAFILSNSTFGWWGACLASDDTKIVVVPNPWYAKLEEPKGLIPENWIRIQK